MRSVQAGVLFLPDIEKGCDSFSCPLDKFCGQSDFTLDVLHVR